MKFFVLANPRAGSSHETDFDKDNLKSGDVTTKCPLCGMTLGMRDWLPPHRVNIIRYGKYFGDISIGTGNSIFVSDAFRQAWLLEKLQGIDFFGAIEVVRIRPAKAATHAPRYWHIIPRISSTAADYARSHFLWDQPPTCDYCGGAAGLDAVAGFTIDESTWSGEDLFRLRKGGASCIVTQRFADMVHKHNLTNALMIPVEQYLWDPLHKIVPYSRHKN